MSTRRALLGALGVAAAGGTAGCLDAIPFLGDEAIEFEASPATVPGSTLDETGYEEHQVEDVRLERTFEVGDRSQDVVVTNWQAEYDRAVDLGAAGLPVDDGRLQAAVFTALATPQVTVLGRTLNPVADMDSGELAEMVQDRYENVQDVERVGEEAATVAGESTTVGMFEAEADLFDTGATLDLTLYVAEAVESGDDLIVAVAAHPAVVDELEAENVFTMMEAIEHEG